MTSSDTVAGPSETALYLSKDGETFGPHTLEEAQSFLESGVISVDDLVWTEGMEQWSAIRDVVDSPAPLDGGEIIPEQESLSEPVPTTPIWAMVHPDGMSRRLGIGLVTAIIFHLGLLMILTIGAPVIFRLRADAPAIAAPEPAPLEVTMVEEPDPPPPPPVQPPPPDDPPPPPAIPDVPIPTDMAPPTPTPVDIPQPVIAPPTTMLAPVAPLAPPSPRPVRVARRVAQPRVVATAAAPVDAGPSDYLYAPAPPYPYAARQQRQQGTVILLVLIDEAGAPTSVTIEQSSGFSLLDEVAQKTARDYRFRVGDSRTLRVPITFQEQ
jgi:protein TonB